MTAPKPDVCRVMAEHIYECLKIETEHRNIPFHVDTLSFVENAIRTHTIVPEMVGFITKISDCTIEDIISRRAEIRADARILLAKAEGGSDG